MVDSAICLRERSYRPIFASSTPSRTQSETLFRAEWFDLVSGQRKVTHQDE